MPTNEQRWEVAQRLREILEYPLPINHDKSINFVEFSATLALSRLDRAVAPVMFSDDYLTEPDELFAALADLIDPREES